MPELERSSFSLLYRNRSGPSSLDLIAKDPNEYRIWTAGLTKLLELSGCSPLARPGELKSLVLDLSIVRNRRSSSSIIDAHTGATAIPQGQTVRWEWTGETHTPSSYKDVAKKFVHLQKKLAKYKLASRSLHIILEESQLSLIRILEESVRKIRLWIQEGHYALSEKELWCAGVDLKSLKHCRAKWLGV
jgi:hypothetical protein